MADKTFIKSGNVTNAADETINIADLLTDIKTVLESLDVTVNASDINIGNVDVVTLPELPAGTKKIGGVTIADGDAATIGLKADARSTATDTTSVTLMQVLKEISYMEQNPAARAVTNANLDIALSALRDAIAGSGAGAKTLANLATLLNGGLPTALTDSGNLKTAISEELPAGTKLVGKFGIDQTSDGTTNKVNAQNATHDNLNGNANIQVGNADVAATNPVNVKGNAARVSASKTRPDNATAYAAGDVVGADPATNLEFASVCANAAAYFVITNVSLEIDVAAVPAGMAGFRLHLYDAAPTAIADNTAYNLPSGDRAKYLGYIDIDTPVKIGDTLFIHVCNVNFQGKLAAASTTLYGMLQTIGAYTPSSQTVKKVIMNVLEV